MLRHESRQLPAWLICDVGRNMKAVASIFLSVVFVATGCHYRPMGLAQRPGWHYERVSPSGFRIYVGVPKQVADAEALCVPSDLTLSSGFRSFEIVPDPQFPQSGTSISFHDNYSGGPGMTLWSIGSSLRIECYSDSADGYRRRLNPYAFIREYRKTERPNKAPEPTTTSGTSAAELPRVPAAVVAHL